MLASSLSKVDRLVLIVSSRSILLADNCPRLRLLRAAAARLGLFSLLAVDEDT